MADYPINQALLDESLKLKEEHNLLKNRLEKIAASREQVSASVFERVHSDYLHRLEEINNKLLNKRQDIDRELSGLFETRDKIQANLKTHKENLEELHFRQTLGEFDRTTFEQKGKMEEEKVTRFEQVLSGVQASIEKYEGLFGEEIFGEAEVSAISEKISPLTPKEFDEWEEEARSAQSSLQEEENFFGPEEEKWLDETKPEIQAESVTTPGSAKGSKAQLTIISGTENIGKSFALNGSAITIGRSHNNLIMLKDGKVSRQHAEVKLHGEAYVLLDLNSSNGTKVNGDKVHEHILHPNDEIQIGNFTLQFQK